MSAPLNLTAFLKFVNFKKLYRKIEKYINQKQPPFVVHLMKTFEALNLTDDIIFSYSSSLVVSKIGHLV